MFISTKRWASNPAPACLGEVIAVLCLDGERIGSRGSISAPDLVLSFAWLLVARAFTSDPMLGRRPSPSEIRGAAGFYEPADEPALLDELRRLAAVHGLGEGRAFLEQALRFGAREVLCCVPPDRRDAPSFFTLEGDPAVYASASWRLSDSEAALGALCEIAELGWDDETDDGEGVLFSWLAPRRPLVARRPSLPPGAVCLESGPGRRREDGELQLEDVTCLGTFELRDDRLEFSGLSQTRLEAAAELVARHLGPLARRASLKVEPLPAGSSQTEPEHSSQGGRADADDRRFQELFYRRWLDDPQRELSGLTPRQATSRPEHRAALERLLRSIGRSSARDRRDGRPGPEVSRLRSELALETPVAA